MICFEVTINGKKVCTAGIEGIGVLTAIFDFARRKKDGEEIVQEGPHLKIGGLNCHGKNDDENLDWVKRHLSVGDEVSIRIIDSLQIDQPKTRKRSDPEFVEKQQRKYYEKLKREYGD